MKKALDLAKKGMGYTSPNPLVGAVLVKDGKVIGKGYHRFYGGPHAEVYAIEDAGTEARGATLYVNLEPCSHYGKTPPCALKIIEAGIKRVVVAMEDPNPLVSGKGIKLLKEAGIEVEVGLMEGEARRLNEIFLKYISTDLPFVIIKIAQTLDGYLATGTGDAKWITNREARLYGHKLRHQVDAILVGIGTVLADNPSLTTRLPAGGGRDGIRIVLDSKLRIPPEARIINQDSPAKTIIACGQEVDQNKMLRLQDKKGVEILPLPLNREGRIPLRELLSRFHSDGISSILVEGGSRVNYSFLKSGLVDRVYTFIAPKILGGSDGIPVFTGEGPAKMDGLKRLKNVRCQNLGDNLLIIGDL